MKSAGKARNNGLYRHIRTSKEIIRNLLNDSYKEQKEYETIEDDIAALETRLGEIDGEMASCARDFVKLNELTEEKTQLETQLEEKMDRWTYLEELAAKILQQNA